MRIRIRGRIFIKDDSRKRREVRVLMVVMTIPVMV